MSRPAIVLRPGAMTNDQKRELASLLGAHYQNLADGTDIKWSDLARDVGRVELVSSNIVTRADARDCSRVALNDAGRPYRRIKDGLRLCDATDFERAIMSGSAKMKRSGIHAAREAAKYVARFSGTIDAETKKAWEYTLEKYRKMTGKIIEFDLVVGRRAQMVAVRTASRAAGRRSLPGVVSP